VLGLRQTSKISGIRSFAPVNAYPRAKKLGHECVMPGGGSMDTKHIHTVVIVIQPPIAAVYPAISEIADEDRQLRLLFVI
jgi:hypothetical protein